MTTDVVVCVHGALQEVSACIASVKRAGGYQRLILVDDHNCDADRRALADLLDDQTVLLSSPKPGYAHAANHGLSESTADQVCLLNSDTLVADQWLQRMAACFSSHSACGAVGPWSNAASWQSVPRQRDWRGRWVINDLPESCDVNCVNERLRRQGPPVYPEVGVLNGFCIMLKRALLDAVTGFDVARFPQGYGEENDLCLRAVDAGFELRVVDNVYVYHVKSASFGHQRRRVLSSAGDQALTAKHGRGKVKELIAGMRKNKALRVARKRSMPAFK
ncbi:MAG: hypothetical protein DHS20C11_07940 [Lysobacteraceae bacterium]|nr:MAG: hypothetical protein DHS20C11_07940 [Xanthomonadaceae bacterium]